MKCSQQWCMVKDRKVFTVLLTSTRAILLQEAAKKVQVKKLVWGIGEV
jgi:hypothetical protein